MYRLVFTKGPLKGERRIIQRQSTTIGRDPDCALHISDDEISWQHAVIEKRENGYYIRDLGSLNKIEINGCILHDEMLNDGDTVSIGGSTFTFQQHQARTSTAERVNHMQKLMFAGAAAIILLEIFFLVMLTFWKRESPILIKPAPEEEPAVTTAQPANNVTTQNKAETTPPIAQLKPAVAETTQAVSTAGIETEEDPAVETKPEMELPDTEEAVDSTDIEEPSEETEVTPASVKQTDEPTEIKPTPEQDPDTPDSPSETNVLEENPIESEPPSETEVVPAEEEASVQADEPIQTQPPQTIESSEQIFPSPEGEEDNEPQETATPQPQSQKEVDPITALAAEMLEKAQLEIRKHNFEDAHRQLERIQILSPNYYPAYAERARLFEHQGKLKEAGEQWAVLMKRSQGTEWYGYATAERSRVAQKEARPAKAPRVSRTRTQTSREAMDALPRQIYIYAVQKERFGETRDFTEMRKLNIVLKARSALAFIQHQDIQVVVTFFDKNSRTGDIRPSRARIPARSLTVDSPWDRGERKTLTAAYIIPSDQLNQFGAEWEYGGYVVRVYYQGRLQDKRGQPETLLDRVSD